MTEVQRDNSQIASGIKKEAIPGKNRKNPPVILRVILFFGILAALLVLAGHFFQPVWYEWSNYDSARGFYEEPENTIGTIIIGSSGAVNAVSPTQMYGEYGISAYNFATEQQPMLVSYYRLEEAWRRHSETLRNVVLEVSILQRGESGEPFYHKGLDGLCLSPVKFRAFRDFAGGDTAKALSYLFPLFSYHTRWTELAAADFRKNSYPLKTEMRGYHFDTLRKHFERDSFSELFLPDYYPDYDAAEAKEMTEETALYLGKIADFCREKNLNLTLLKVTSPDWTVNAHNTAGQAAEKYGLPYLDFNYEPFLGEAGIDTLTDMRDSHMNYYGAVRISSYLGKYLKEECGAEDVRGRKGYEFLDGELEKYRETVDEMIALRSEKDPSEYLAQVIKNPDYTVFLAVRGEGSKTRTEKQAAVFAETGLEELAALEYRSSYLGVIENGKVLFEKTKPDPGDPEKESSASAQGSDEAASPAMAEEAEPAEGPYQALSCKGRLSDGSAYAITSGGKYMGNAASVLIDGTEQCLNGRGLNVVVYDTRHHEVADTASFDLGQSPVRIGLDLRAELEAALKETKDYGSLDPDLKKLYLYDQRAADAKKVSYLMRPGNKSGLADYLEAFGGEKGHGLFLLIKDLTKLDEASRKILKELGAEETVKLKAGSAILVLQDGRTVLEKCDAAGGLLKKSGKLGKTGISYAVRCGGADPGEKNRVTVNKIKHGVDNHGIGLGIWNTQTRLEAAFVKF